MRTHRICPSCQRGSYVQDASHCPYCGTEYQAPVAAAPAVVTPVVVTPIDSRRWWSIIGIVLGFVVLVIILTGIIWGGIYFFTRYNPKDVGLNNIPKETTSGQTNPTDGKTEGTTSGTTAATTAETTIETTTETTATTDNILPVVAKGLNIGSEQKFLVEPGDVVVGDIAVINNDNTREPLYDNDPATALVTVFKTQTWVWTEWGCFHAKQASQSEIDKLVADKKQDVHNYREVILINWPSN